MKVLAFVLSLALGLASTKGTYAVGASPTAPETAFGTSASPDAAASDRISRKTFLVMKREAAKLRKLGKHLKTAAIYSRFRGHKFEHNIEYNGSYRTTPYKSTFHADGRYTINVGNGTVIGKWKAAGDKFCTKPEGATRYGCDGRVYAVTGGTVIWFKLNSGVVEVDGLIRKN